MDMICHSHYHFPESANEAGHLLLHPTHLKERCLRANVKGREIPDVEWEFQTVSTIFHDESWMIYTDGVWQIPFPLQSATFGQVEVHNGWHSEVQKELQSNLSFGLLLSSWQ
jgi:hypothetical protein